jgi:hypothetical protein
MPEINVNEMTFGVEIETHIPRGRLAVGPHRHGYPIPELRNEWKADRDPSIRDFDGRTREACEFVSGIFKGEAGLAQLLQDLATIKSFGAAVNSSCGLHIHVGFDKSNVKNLRKVVTMTANLEKAIFASTGTKNRETGRWAKSVRVRGNAVEAIRVQRDHQDRYFVINVITTHETVEFRAFGSTLNATKLVGYIRLCFAIVEKSLSGATAKWAGAEPAEKSSLRRGGDGHTAITRLFRRLGWTGRNGRHINGNLNCDGAPSLKDCQKEFVRLAKKYDAGN